MFGICELFCNFVGCKIIIARTRPLKQKTLDMRYLKIIFYGALALAEKHPLFCLTLLAALILPPIFFEWVRWLMLGALIVTLIIIAVVWWKIRSLKQKFEQQYRDAMGGMGAGFSGFGNGNSNGAGFSGFNFAHGMRLEDFVQQMQQQADARQQNTQQTSTHSTTTKTQKSGSNQGEYVDFEEIE